MKAGRHQEKRAYMFILVAALPALAAGAVCVAAVLSPNFGRTALDVPGRIAYDLLTLARATIMSTASLLLALATFSAWRDWRARRRPTWYAAVVGALWLGLMIVMEPFFGYLSLRVSGLL